MREQFISWVANYKPGITSGDDGAIEIWAETDPVLRETQKFSVYRIC